MEAIKKNSNTPEYNESKKDDQNITATESFDDIGQYLKNARTKKGMTLEEVSRRTKVLLTILKELEKGNLPALPDKTYIKGFVRAYAKEVGLNINNATEVLDRSYQRLQNESGRRENDNENAMTNNHAKFLTSNHLSSVSKGVNVGVEVGVDVGHSHEKNHSFKGIAITVIALIFISIPVYYFYNVISSSIERKKNTLESTISSSDKQVLPSSSNNTNTVQINATTTTKTEQQQQSMQTPMSGNLLGETSSILPVINKDSDIKIMDVKIDSGNTQNQNQNQNPLANSPSNINNPANNASNKDINNNQKTTSPNIDGSGTGKILAQTLETNIKFKKMTTPVYKLMESYESSNEGIIPKHIKDAYSPSKENVYIKAVDGDSWITYKKDGNQVQSLVLRKGRGLFIQGSEVRIFMGNIPATKIYYNNKHLDPGSGIVKNLVFPASNASKYALPMFVRLKDGSVLTSDEYQNKIVSEVGQIQKTEQKINTETNSRQNN